MKNQESRPGNDGAVRNNRLRHSMKYMLSTAVTLVVLLSAAYAQEPVNPAVRGGGTSGTLPVFTGAQTVGNSPMQVNQNGSISTTIDHPVEGAIEATNSSSTGDPTGIHGHTVSNDRGIAVRGTAESPIGTGIGVLGEALAEGGIAVVGNAASEVGGPIGVFGYITSQDGGIGVVGQAQDALGYGVGVQGEAFSSTGTGGVFVNHAGGTILAGIGPEAVVFRVDGAGNVFSNSFNVGGADFAESFAVAGQRVNYAAGDLLAIDTTARRQLALAQEPYSKLVAGIFSTKPGVVASPHALDDPALANEVPLAIVGIVPCKVSTENGAIRAGDLLVTSSTPGHAMRGTDLNRMLGAVVGKALEPLPDGKGVIQVLVTLQ